MGNGDSAPVMVPMLSTPVKLAVSPFGPKVPGIPQAHHTSLSIGNLEYSFGPQGIGRNPPYQSHAFFPGSIQVQELGKTDVSGEWLLKALTHHFKEGSYDLLRKNCNSFSDCALYYTLGLRLDDKYKALETLGVDADKMGVVRMLSLGEYKPNPKAEEFDLKHVIDLAKRGRKAVIGDKSGSESPRKALKKGHAGERKSNPYYVGQNVQVRSKSHEGWVNATVMGFMSDGGVNVRYESGQFQKDVPRSLLDKHVRQKE